MSLLVSVLVHVGVALMFTSMLVCGVVFVRWLGRDQGDPRLGRLATPAPRDRRADITAAQDRDRRREQHDESDEGAAWRGAA